MVKRDLTNPGDILFYKVTSQSGFRAKIIAMAELFRKEGTGSTQYSHVAICDWNKDFQFEAVWPKTRISPIDWGNPDVEVWRVKGLSVVQISKVLVWAGINLGKPYDLGQALLGLFTWSNAYSCAEFVCTAFKEVPIDLAPNAGRFIAPNELVSDLIVHIA